MTSSGSSLPERRARARTPDVRACLRRGAAAAVLTTLFLLAYGGTLAAYLQQGAPLAQPGDRLLVVFPRDTDVPTALQRLGEAGAVLSDGTGAPPFYRAEVIDGAAGRRLAGDAWVLRLPRSPTLEGCFSLVTEGR